MVRDTGAGRRLAAILVLAFAALLSGAAPARAGVPAARVSLDVCQLAPTLTQPVCRALGNAIPGGAGVLSGAAGLVTQGLAGGVLGSVSEAMAEGASWFVSKVAVLVTSSTSIDVTAGWFTVHYRVMAGIAAVFAVAFVLLTAAGSLLHRDATRSLHAVGMTAAAGLGTGAAVSVTQMLLVLTDELTRTVSTGGRDDLAAALTGAGRLAGTAGFGTPSGAPAMVTLLAGAAAIVAGLLLWVELLLREAAVYAALLFFPLALAGLAWEPTRRWTRRLAETLAALIFSKFVVAGVLALALGGLGRGDGATAVLSGAGLLWVAALAPFLLMRIIGVLEVGVAAAHLEGVRSRATHTGVYYAQTASYVLARRGASGVVPLAATAAAAPYASGWPATAAVRGVAGTGMGPASGPPTGQQGTRA